MKNFLKKNYILIILLVIQSIIYIAIGNQKNYLHIDEAYSYGLTHYDKVEIADNEDFYNNWHNKEYYEEYLSVQKDEVGNYKQVYENQKNDVHPPFYYLLLRIGMELTVGHYSKWPGLILNVIIYAFATIFIYLITKKLLGEEKNSKVKALIIAFMSALTLASISNVIYTRMYALFALEVLITIYLHLKLLEQEKINWKILLLIGIVALLGILTHYYYIIYLAIMYMLFAIKYIKRKEFKKLIFYTITMLIAGMLSLIIFPHSIRHMFFGYRGQGVIYNLCHATGLLDNLVEYIRILNQYQFNNLFYLVVIIMFGTWIYKKITKKRKIEKSKEQKEILEIIYIPCIFYYLLVGLASPWRILRYIVPIFAPAFIAIIFYLYNLLKTSFGEKKANIVTIVLFILMLISPFIFKLEPELFYQDKKDILQKVEEAHDVPGIYFTEANDNRFLNNIILFTKLDETYISRDKQSTKETWQEILKEKDISNGMFLIISEETNKDEIIEKIKEATELKDVQFIKGLYECEVYYIK